MATLTILRMLSRIISILYFLFSIFLFSLCILLFYVLIFVKFIAHDFGDETKKIIEKYFSVDGDGFLLTGLAYSLVFLGLAAINAYASVELFRATAKDIKVEKATEKALFFRNVTIAFQILEGFSIIFMMRDFFFDYYVEVIRFGIFLLVIYIIFSYVKELEESRKGAEALKLNAVVKV